MRTTILLVLAVSLSLFSCKKDKLELTGSPSMVGAVGNTLTFSHGLTDVGSVDMTVTEFTDGISTLETVITLTNDDLLDMAEHIEALYPTKVQVSGNTVTTEMQARFTTDGIAAVAPNGDELVVCKYDANVGDTWTINADGRTVKHEVTQRSSEDDFEWGFWLLKVVTMDGTNYGIPGLNKVLYISNHRFGPVAVKAFMSDGSVLDASIFSDFENE